MAKKFYVVKKGVKPGIYLTWDECRENVNGYSGAEYKSFSNEREAKLYLGIKNDYIKKIPMKKLKQRL